MFMVTRQNTTDNCMANAEPSGLWPLKTIVVTKVIANAKVKITMEASPELFRENSKLFKLNFSMLLFMTRASALDRELR